MIRSNHHVVRCIVGIYPLLKRACVPCIRIKTVLIAQAEAEKIRRIGEAEACSIEAVGKAEAEKMRLKAEAYQQYGEAAKTALVLEALPMVKHRWVPLGSIMHRPFTAWSLVQENSLFLFHWLVGTHSL